MISNLLTKESKEEANREFMEELDKESMSKERDMMAFNLSNIEKGKNGTFKMKGAN